MRSVKEVAALLKGTLEIGRLLVCSKRQVMAASDGFSVHVRKARYNFSSLPPRQHNRAVIGTQALNLRQDFGFLGHAQISKKNHGSV